MKNVWVGLHDHADSAPRLLDRRVSYSWIRAFEQASVVPIAYLREHYYRADIEEPIRNVRYRFRPTEIASWVDDIVRENPTLVLYNCCYYAEGVAAVQALHDRLPDTVHVIRIHHQVEYLASRPGFREFLLSCDVAIAPTPQQAEAVRRLGFTGPVHALPFGVDAEAARKVARPSAGRDIDIAAASNSHPARNRALVEGVFARLRERGYRAENFVGVPPKEFLEGLGRTKVFWQTSMTEASGSRVLAEAIAAGCYPVAFEESVTTRDMLFEHKVGAVIPSGISFDTATKTATYPDGTAAALTEKLDQVLKARAETHYDPPALRAEYHEGQEIDRLIEILEGAASVRRQPSPVRRQQLHLPVDAGGYAFNPTFLRTTAGLVCIYRHVDAGGTRSLRRCMLGDDYGVTGFSVWSDEVSRLGGEVKWYADPRLFVGPDGYYCSLNTGHSERPNQIYLVKIDADGAPLSAPMKLVKTDGRREIEKNWGFFSAGGAIYAVYSLAPFAVLKVTLRDNIAEATPFASHPWDAAAIEASFGELHGGAAPVIIGDRGYYVVQSNAPSDVGQIYRGSLFVFNATPPFAPIAVAPEPLFTLAADEVALIPAVRLNPPVTQCFYPAGAINESAGALTICYGINDFRAGARSYDLARLEQGLVPIGDAPPPVKAKPLFGLFSRLRAK